jgi:hypothetical protein
MTSQDLQDRLKTLAAFLEDPHPGLYTWNEACIDVAEQIFLGIYGVSGPKIRKKLLKKLKGIK